MLLRRNATSEPTQTTGLMSPSCESSPSPYAMSKRCSSVDSPSSSFERNDVMRKSVKVLPNPGNGAPGNSQTSVMVIPYRGFFFCRDFVIYQLY